ncbi:gamma-glutamylcyclotransferase family protein [Leptolyngbya sp. CCNP1308]|uniref:gamma-glutamylcyclotransferase family protein n=1 Tax=Leptolyngbya sp. CCNP1308 TaxID=3110255 RepID=UPI002B206510|nr:gamma-glutamylcyclotransferase family protein [Leptolyngbya sp. CCNP1308]MEA5451126.1 gamma-glutamylcyclotransferase family protein [Leptolyngbya sp. CCNP1308]
MSSDSPCSLFVYGTLKPGERAFTSLCEPFAIAAQPAQTLGRLYHLPLGYPAMTPEPGWVQGFLLTLSNADALTAIDAFEEYYPDRPESSEYQRSLQMVYDLSQRSLEIAWVYTMSPEQVDGLGGLWLPNGYWTDTLIF